MRQGKGLGGVVSSGGISDAVAKAERLARQGRFDVASAREVMNSLLVAAGQQPVDVVTNRAWCDSWRAAKKGTVKLFCGLDCFGFDVVVPQ